MPETIGLLLGVGLVVRFLGSLLTAPRVNDPSRPISALRVPALLALLFTVVFWAGAYVAWLVLVMVGLSLFFSPLVPLTNALANTWQKQLPLDYGKVRLWGSVAFVIGLALTGRLVSMSDYRVILALLMLGVVSMLLDFLICPTIQPQGASRQQESTGWSAQLALARQNWYFLVCVCLLQRAHMVHYGFSAIYWQVVGYSVSAVGYLRSLGAMAEVIIFTLSNKPFRRCSACGMLLISAVCGVVHQGTMGATTTLPWLIVAQTLHCGIFTVYHLAAVRYIAACQGSEVIHLQAVYSAVMMGGSIATMTVFAGLLYQYLGRGMFWVTALMALPVMFLCPKVVPLCRFEHFVGLLLLMCCQRQVHIDQR